MADATEIRAAIERHEAALKSLRADLAAAERAEDQAQTERVIAVIWHATGGDPFTARELIDAARDAPENHPARGLAHHDARTLGQFLRYAEAPGFTVEQIARERGGAVWRVAT